VKLEEKPRIAWGLTGSGHYLKECLEFALALNEKHPGLIDFYLSKAAAEVLHMYTLSVKELQQRARVFRDQTASAAPVGLFYHGHYHTVIVGPATSNTVAKMVVGISDTLITNIFAQAGKQLIPTIVFACDTEPVVETESPSEWVTLYPRRIDLENTERLKTFEHTTVVNTVDGLEAALGARLQAIGNAPIISQS
jgi:dihydromethanopterin reductase (acceptor)